MAVRDRAPAQALSDRRAGGVPLTLTAVGSVQVGSALAKTLFDDVGPAGTALLRVGFAAVTLLAIWRPSPRRHGAGRLGVVVAFGLALGAMNLSFYEALDRIPLGVAVTIEFLGPLGVAVALSRRRVDVGWAALAALGVLLLAGPAGGGVDRLGVALALAAAACWAAYIVLASAAGRLFSGGRGLALALGVAVLVPVGPGVASAGTELLAPAALGIGAAVALLSSVVPYSLETEALRRLPRRVFGILMSLEPAVAALAGLVVLGQGLSARQVAAIALVVLASVGATRRAPALAPEA
jgi:inner membrane transporter RhtA